MLYFLLFMVPMFQENITKQASKRLIRLALFQALWIKKLKIVVWRIFRILAQNSGIGILTTGMYPKNCFFS